MEVYCTRPYCHRPENHFADLDDLKILRTAQQKYCTSCGMPLMLDGRYVPFKLLGKGGFGAAFLARDRRIPGTPLCVVKQFQPAGHLTPAQIEVAERLFEREAEVLAYIGQEHEQITELLAYFSITVSNLQTGNPDQFFYLVQEYIDGQNLEEELAQQGKFSEQQALNVLTEVLKILKFIHSKDIIHRDIKPSNIMRRRDGKLFLLDFGAVKQKVTSISGAVTNSSTGIYTPGFAAPEQIAGNQVFQATDLYALAATMINLLTGQEPTQLIDPHSNRWIWQKQVSISRDFVYILNKMLLPAAKERYQSADEVLLAIDKYLHVSNSPTKLVVNHTFSVEELLIGAGLSGWEGALMAIAFFHLIPSPIIAFALAAIILSLLILAQSQRRIQQLHLLIICAISFVIVWFFLGISPIQLVVTSIAGGLLAIAATALFRLIYKLLSWLI